MNRGFLLGVFAPGQAVSKAEQPLPPPQSAEHGNASRWQTNRKVIAITLVLIILTVFVALVLYSQNSSPDVEVSNVELTYGPQTFFGISMGNYIPVISFTVKNAHNSYLTTVGLNVDGADYGISTLELPPGQVQSESLPLQNVNLASSRTYRVKLTFTFADGRYQSYSQSYTTPQFQGRAQVTSSSLTLGQFLSSFSLTLQNTGNLPITNVNCMVANSLQAFFLMSGGAVMPRDSITGGWGDAYSSSIFQASTAYSVTIQLTYADGSTSTLQTSVIAH